MLRCSLILLLLALVAGLLAFTGIGGGVSGVARIFFYVLLGLLVLSLVAGWFKRSSRSTPDL